MTFPPLAIYNGSYKDTGMRGPANVSQALNTVYHGPAQLGDLLRIVSTTITTGARVLTAQWEVRPFLTKFCVPS